MIQTVTKDTFETLVVNSEKPVLIDFWAEWCGPCRMLSPVMDQIAADPPQLLVGKINVDDEGELARQFGIVSIPTVVALKNGTVIGRSVGVKPKEAILAMVE